MTNKLSVNFENVLRISTELNLDISKTLLRLKSIGISSLDVDFKRLVGENSYMKEIIISGITIGSVISVCPLHEKDNLQIALSTVDFCAEYKIKEITIVAQPISSKFSELQIFNLKQNLRRIVKYAENFGVTIAIKNLNEDNYPIKTANEASDVLKSVKGLRLVFDGGNFITSGQDLIDASNILAPYAQRYTIKDFSCLDGELRVVSVGDGNCKCKEVFDIFKEFYPKIPLVIEFPLSDNIIYERVENSATYVLTEIL